MSAHRVSFVLNINGSLQQTECTALKNRVESDDATMDDYKSTDPNRVDLKFIHNILKQNHINIDTNDLLSAFGQYKHDKSTFIGDLLDAFYVQNEENVFNLKYDARTIKKICEILLYQYFTETDINNSNFIKLAQQIVTKSAYDTHADEFQCILTKTDTDTYTLIKGIFDVDDNPQFLNILKNIHFQILTMWNTASANIKISKYTPSLFSGVYGYYLFYQQGQLIDHPSHLIEQFHALSTIKQLELSIPEEISVFHILHQLSKHNVHDPDLYANPYLQNVIVSNSKEEFCVPNVQDVISIFDNEHMNWKSILYDVALYHYAECHINDAQTDAFANIQMDTKHTGEWKAYLETRSSPKEMTIDVQPQHKIMDNLLAYHHYTIAVSHILKSYHMFPQFTVSIVFVINQRQSMDEAPFADDIESILNHANIAYITRKLNALDLNETIKIMFGALYNYKDISTSNEIVLLLELEHKHPSSACTMFIYDHQSVPDRAFIPHIDDNHCRLFILQFLYVDKKHVRCYWKIDGKTLRFFPEHMETIWPQYFAVPSTDINQLIYHHKYRHQFGVGLYDKAFCTLYYAVTRRRFLSTHYYRRYQIVTKLSLRNINVDVESSTFDLFYDKVADLLNEASMKDNKSLSAKEKPFLQHNKEQYTVYTAEHSDDWLTAFNPPTNSCMKDEFLYNSFSDLDESDYMDLTNDCQILHKNKQMNTQIMSSLEIAALKVFVDYPEIQAAFCKAYYDNNYNVDETQKRRCEFYRWNLVLRQAMHYAAAPFSYERDTNSTLWRGLNGLFHFESIDVNTHQPNTFSVDKRNASAFCENEGILLEADAVIGIPLNWVSAITQGVESWLSFENAFKLKQIHVKTEDVTERVNYLKYALQNTVHEDIDIFQFDDDNVTAEYVLRMLDFEEKDSEILKEIKYNNCTLLQTLFFELKQHHMLRCIWNPQLHDIERCSTFQRMYVLKHKIFASINESDDAFSYSRYIMNIMDQDQVSPLDPSLSDIFTNVMNECVVEYNADSKNRFKISNTQRESVINYFKTNSWDLNRFISTNATEPHAIKRIFIRELKKRSPANKLYNILKDKISSISGTKSSVSFDAFYSQYAKYKQIDKCNTLQFVYILEKHIFLKTEQHSETITLQNSAVEYIRSHELDGSAFLCGKHDFNALCEAIKQWEADKGYEALTILDYKLQNTNYNAFQLLIGDFEMKISKDVDKEYVFAMKLTEKQRNLIQNQPPVFILSLYINKTDKKEVESSTPLFRTEISSNDKPADIKYRISLKFNEYELVSNIRHTSL